MTSDYLGGTVKIELWSLIEHPESNFTIQPDRAVCMNRITIISVRNGNGAKVIPGCVIT